MADKHESHILDGDRVAATVKGDLGDVTTRGGADYERVGSRMKLTKTGDVVFVHIYESVEAVAERVAASRAKIALANQEQEQENEKAAAAAASSAPSAPISREDRFYSTDGELMHVERDDSHHPVSHHEGYRTLLTVVERPYRLVSARVEDDLLVRDYVDASAEMMMMG
jgi:hypothetical protein